MTRQPLDDADIAQLVYDLTDGWTMPPVRLDSPAWRDRVRSRRVRRADAIRGWLAPLGRAATGAVALTVVGALIAVILTRSPIQPGKSPSPSDGSGSRSSDSARPTPLPKLLVNGDVPSPSELLVRTEPSTFAFVDLVEGTMGRPLIAGSPGGEFGSVLQVRSDGTLVCLCLSESGYAGGSPTTAAIRVDRLDPSGQLTSSQEVESFTGAPDPRDEARSPQDSLPNVRTAVGFSDGVRFGFVGWSYRTDLTLKSGLLVVDLRADAIVSRLDLPDMTSGEGDSRRVLEPPRVVGQDGEQLIVARSWADLANASSSNPSYSFDVDAFRVAFPGGVLGEPTQLAGTAACGDTIRFAGELADGGTWLVCTRGDAFQTRLRRIAGDGVALPDVTVNAAPGIEGDVTAVTADGRTAFAWDPANAKLTRIDTASGETAFGEGLVARADAGPLDALGRWLTPVATAKSFVVSAVLLSPDESRVYAIGVKDGVDHPEDVGSAGVFVFDAATLALIDLYQPTADFVSLAIEASGRYVYAAGLPGFDELGSRRPDQGASITVFDTADGSVRRIAGQLGSNVITFGPEAAS